ncbi:hypothetical protein D3C71_1393340 [compost metagenome]
MGDAVEPISRRNGFTDLPWIFPFDALNFGIRILGRVNVAEQAVLALLLQRAFIAVRDGDGPAVQIAGGIAGNPGEWRSVRGLKSVIGGPLVEGDREEFLSLMGQDIFAAVIDDPEVRSAVPVKGDPQPARRNVPGRQIEALMGFMVHFKAQMHLLLMRASKIEMLENGRIGRHSLHIHLILNAQLLKKPASDVLPAHLSGPPS